MNFLRWLEDDAPPVSVYVFVALCITTIVVATWLVGAAI